GATAIFADVRFVGDFPIADLGAALAIVAHQFVNELLPCVVIVGLDYVVIEFREEDAWFEADAHQRLRASGEDRIDRAIERFEVISPAFGHEVEELLNEEPNEARVEYAQLGNAIGELRMVGKA